jgi:hypothetical protein
MLSRRSKTFYLVVLRCPMPYDPSMLVQKNQGDPKDAKDQLRYSHIIGSLM